MARGLKDVIAAMERRRGAYGQATDDLRRVALCATLTGDDPRWRFSAFRRDRPDAARSAEDVTPANAASRAAAEQARRRYQRQPGYGIESSLDAAGLAPAKAVLVDISRGGAAFECQWAAQPGLQVVINFAGGRRRLRARVVRSTGDALAVSFLQDPAQPDDTPRDASSGLPHDLPCASGGEAPSRDPTAPTQDSVASPRARMRRGAYRLRLAAPSEIPALSGLVLGRRRPSGPRDPLQPRPGEDRQLGQLAMDMLGELRAVTHDLQRCAGLVRERREHRIRLLASWGGGLLAGALLWHVLVMSLPSRTGDWLAALPLGGGPWQAGQALMRRDNPESWDKMVRLYTACGDQPVALCERAAMAVRDAPAPPAMAPMGAAATKGPAGQVASDTALR
jgi:hypothetical protein